MAEDDGPWRTTEEGARRIKKSKSFLEHRRIDGTGPRFYKIGRKCIYHVNDLDAWVREQPSEPTRYAKKR